MATMILKTISGELKGALKDYLEVYENDDNSIAEIEKAMENIDDAIEELRSEMPSEPDTDDFYARSIQEGGQADSRSIFDDVDT